MQSQRTYCQRQTELQKRGKSNTMYLHFESSFSWKERGCNNGIGRATVLGDYKDSHSKHIKHLFYLFSVHLDFLKIFDKRAHRKTI